jgi:glycosyltransferase involved in cell wall biosynthesis
MNILNVTTMEGLRGGDAQMYIIYNLLKDKPDLTQYIMCPETADLAKMCQEDGANLITYKRNRFKIFNAINCIVKASKKHKIDLIHVHDSSALTLSLVALLFLNSKTKLVLSRKRNNKIKEFFLNKYKYSHPKISKIISVSKAVEAIFDTIIKDKNRLLTIYDAIDVKKIASIKDDRIIHKEFNLANDTIIIGNIAGLDDQKDIFTFIDTAKKIKESSKGLPEIKFFVFGRGPKKEELQNYITKNQLDNDVILAGYRNDVLQILPELDILLMTSIEEGLPLSIYEAFAAKVPVVSTDAGGIKEVVKNDETGFVTARKDSTALAHHCLQIIKNQTLKTTITENAFQVVSNNHDLKNLEENYYNFYKTI